MIFSGYGRVWFRNLFWREKLYSPTNPVLAAASSSTSGPTPSRIGRPLLKTGSSRRRRKKKKWGWRRFLDFWLRGSSCHRRWLRPLEADRDAGGGGVRWQRRRRRRRRWRWSVHDELVANYAKLFLVYLSCSFDQFQSVLRLYGAK